MTSTPLITESRNPRTTNLDTMSTLDLVSAMNREDLTVPMAIRSVLPNIATTVDVIADRMSNGGRVIFVGAGTSGRIAALEAYECPLTFGVSPETVQALVAGAKKRLLHSPEDCEDSAELGRREMSGMRPAKQDVVIGIAASGCTPYTVGALRSAKRRGSTTIAIACNRQSELGKIADICIEVEVGPEVLSGSSRLKAGTAQKMICNMLTTGAMARLGYVYSNYMVSLHLGNNKGLKRGVHILELLTRADSELIHNTLKEADLNVAVALLMLKMNVDKAESLRRLHQASGNVRKALQLER